MEDKKTDLSNTPLSDDLANPTKGLSAKSKTASHPAGAEPGLDTLFHRTSLRFCCASKMLSASEARDPQSLSRLQQSLVRAHRDEVWISHIQVKSAPPPWETSTQVDHRAYRTNR